MLGLAALPGWIDRLRIVQHGDLFDEAAFKVQSLEFDPLFYTSMMKVMSSAARLSKTHACLWQTRAAAVHASISRFTV